MTQPGDLPDPVAAYDLVAAHFSELSARRREYLAAIEKIIVSRIPSGAHSLLDIGSGDGTRALRIAQSAGIGEVVLLEPSPALCAKIQIGEVWPIRAEEIGNHPIATRGRRFDVITCLWNVLGHIRTAEARGELLRQLQKRLTPQGRLFMDVIHRYNIRSYGVTKTAVRYLLDRINPRETNGDVIVKWEFENASCLTFGHVFTHREILALVQHAGLQIESRAVVDYETGAVQRAAFLGNLLYEFRRNSAIAFPKAATTSSTSASVI